MKYTLKNKEIELTDEEVKEIVRMSEEKKVGWIPEDDEEYWYVSSSGDIYEEVWDSHNVDNFRLSQGNVFRTQEEAQAHLTYLKAVATLKESAEFWQPDWGDEEQKKYYVYYGCHYGRFEMSCSWRLAHPLNIHFQSEAKAEESIKNYEKEWKIVLGINE